MVRFRGRVARRRRPAADLLAAPELLRDHSGYLGAHGLRLLEESSAARLEFAEASEREGHRRSRWPSRSPRRPRTAASDDVSLDRTRLENAAAVFATNRQFPILFERLIYKPLT